ncbi:MAG: TIGR00730 family Rossman fold protein [candidate division Zixibacteria bacterium]|nr:TIGR00730 family Rossman fold protein [candidate division Zixibacteria bacterium]
MTTKKKPSPKKWWETEPSYRLAFEDNDLLMKDELRGVRLQLELVKTELSLLEHNIRSTIVVFGGTRISAPDDCKKKIKEIEAELKDNPRDPVLLNKLLIARRVIAKSDFYNEARRFAELVSRESQNGNGAEYVIVTGGGPGIMEAANRGAHDIGAKSIGLNITLPMEQQPNEYITPDLCFQFHYFAVRKMHFLMRAKALVAFPGGYGTLDELFEGLTLLQTTKTQKIPIILFGKNYWTQLINFDFLVAEGTIDPEDLALFRYADTAEQTWEMIQEFNKEPIGWKEA